MEVNKVEDKVEEEEIKCNRCGDCCRTLHIRIPLAEEVEPRLLRGNMMLYWGLHEGVSAQLQRTEEGKMIIMLMIQSPCSMLQTHADGTCSCKIYFMRPPICRAWPMELDRFRHSDIPRCSMLLDPITGRHEDALGVPKALLESESGQRKEMQ